MIRSNCKVMTQRPKMRENGFDSMGYAINFEFSAYTTDLGRVAMRMNVSGKYFPSPLCVEYTHCERYIRMARKLRSLRDSGFDVLEVPFICWANNKEK